MEDLKGVERRLTMKEIDGALEALEQVYRGQPKDMFYARIRTALEQRRVPEGWKLVPLWPTRAMCEAMQWQIGGTKQHPVKTWGSIESAYGAALAAAPEADDG